MTKPTLIKAAYFYQSVNINNKEVLSVQAGKDVRVSRKTGNYDLHWIDNTLHVTYTDGSLDIIPIGNIKKMTVDVEKTQQLWEKEQQTPTKSPVKRRPGRRLTTNKQPELSS